MSDSPAPNAVLLTMEASAEHLGLTLRQMRILVTAEDAPKSVRIGRRRYLRRADLDAWVEEQFRTQAHA